MAGVTPQNIHSSVWDDDREFSQMRMMVWASHLLIITTVIVTIATAIFRR